MSRPTGFFRERLRVARLRWFDGFGRQIDPARCARDAIDRHLGPAVRKQEPIRLLVRIGELRVAAPAEHADREHRTYQALVATREVFGRGRARVSPRSPFTA